MKKLPESPALPKTAENERRFTAIYADDRG